MPTVDSDLISKTSGADRDSFGRNAEVKRRRLIQPSIRKPSAKITVRSARPHMKSGKPTCSSAQKKKQSKKVPPRGSVRHFPCRQCVARASKAPGHECASQDNTGAACWDCAKNGHTCRPVPVEARAAVRTFWDLNRQLSDADEEPGEVWRAAAQRAAQQLRACGSGAAPPPTRPAPALASFGEVTDGNFEERKLITLETIAGAARLWILNQPDEEDGDEEEEDD
ncbi:hypothetical protein S40285_10797 [Stachybotrys chlorohalonatus IBT 40285]|uniref:Uncharacterized protein n=1 Tax=Stachybotrys chlorohalonatus (strain IBT 40285) TaxID=1283841 RepID=A0A084QFN0_STAC4|nr:hypothetical protein S40285_10797 [Stachybotrys chlorohalonata IBT 40285]